MAETKSTTTRNQNQTPLYIVCIALLVAVVLAIVGFVGKNTTAGQNAELTARLEELTASGADLEEQLTAMTAALDAKDEEITELNTLLENAEAVRAGVQGEFARLLRRAVGAHHARRDGDVQLAELAHALLDDRPVAVAAHDNCNLFVHALSSEKRCQGHDAYGRDLAVSSLFCILSARADAAPGQEKGAKHALIEQKAAHFLFKDRKNALEFHISSSR